MRLVHGIIYFIVVIATILSTTALSQEIGSPWIDVSGKNNKEIEEIIIKDIKTLKSYTARKIEGTVTEMQNEDENRRLEYNNNKSDLRTALNSAIDTKNDISMEVNDLIDQLALYKSEVSALQQKILDADSSTAMSNLLINEQKEIIKDELTKIPFFEVCIARKKGIGEDVNPGNIDDKMNHEISKLAIGNQLGMKIVKQTIIKDGTLNAETVQSVLAGKANANLTLAQIPVEQNDGSILFDRYLYGLVTVYPFQEKDVSLTTTPGMGGIDIEFDILNTTSQGIATDLPSDEKRRLNTILNDKKIKNGDSESQVKRLARTAKRLIATENSKISRNTKNSDDYGDQIKNINPLIDDLGSQLNELDGEQQLANAKFHVAKTEYEKHVFNESYVEVFPWEGYISADASIMDSYASFAVESFQEFLTSIKSEYLREETELAGESFSEVKESKKSNVKLNEIKLLGKFAEKKGKRSKLSIYIAYNFGFEFEQATDTQPEVVERLTAKVSKKPARPVHKATTPSLSNNLTVTTSPPGAIVKAGRKTLGTTPLKAYLEPGLHSLVVAKDGYQNAMEMVDVDGSKVVTSHIVLQALPAQEKTVAKQQKKGGNKLLILAGTAILGGGAAFYLISQQEEEPQTGSVTISIDIP
tara:strand:- start:888 stop:2816 length:1929 start_codon:yes stop_codon:yes gene_type:complete